MKNIRVNSKGFTLIEVMIVLILLSLAFMVFLYALNTGKSVRVNSELRTIQAVLLKNLQNQIRARNFDDPVSGSSTFGPETGESSINLFDDIDDFDDYTVTSIADYPAFSYSVVVQYVPLEEDGFDLNTNDPESPTNYKSVKVTVSHGTLPDIFDIMIISSES